MAASNINEDASLDLLSCFESAAASAATDLTAVDRAEKLFAQWQTATTSPSDDNNTMSDEKEARRAYNALLQTYAMAPPPNDDDDDICLTRLTELLAVMVDGDHAPTPNDESYAWLLEAHIQRQDWRAARQVWQALVDFQAQQPAWTLTARLWEQHQRIPLDDDEGETDDSNH